MKSLISLMSLLTIGLQAQVKFDFTEPVPLPDHINSPYEETAPVYDKSQDILYFTRAIHPENTGGATAPQDIWFSRKTSAGWDLPSKDLLNVNNLLNNSVIGVSEDGNELFLLSTYEKKLSLQQGFSQTLRAGIGWQRPRKVNIPGLSIKGNFYGGWMNALGSIMIISMESKDSEGEEDLYISFLQDGKWTKPLWMGDSLNTSGYEISPYLFDDGITLMFASSGHEGLGDCDIYFAYRKDSTWTNWTAPRNMGAPVNSEAFDAFAYPVDDQMYFASSRGGGLGNIYLTTNTKFFREADVLRVAFKSFDTPISDVRIEVADAYGKSVGSYVGRHKDVVEIPGLTEKKSYTLRPSHDQVDLNLCDAYILNANNVPVSLLRTNAEGLLVVVPETSADMKKRNEMAMEAYAKGLHGVYELDRVPVRNVVLAMVDEGGKTVQYARTDNEGRFAFAETPDESQYSLKVLTELEYLRNNGIIYFTDQDGNKLFKAKLNELGLYDYQKLEAREMAQLRMLKELGDNKLDPGKGVFKYDNLPREGVKLFLVDENDNVIEEVVTDAQGQFKFSKLKPDSEFRIKTADEDLEASGLSKVFFLDAFGRELDVLRFSENTKAYAYKPLSRELTTNLKLISEEEDASKMRENFVFSVGLFKYKTLPTQGVVLKLYDENDRVIETVTTDQYGNFVFSMLRPNMSYAIRVEGADDTYLRESELYFVSKDGKVTNARLEGDRKYSFTKLNPQYFFNISQINEGETELKIEESFKDVVGVYNYKSLPRSGVKLYLVDENDKVIETVYTDDQGRFKFGKLAKESSFVVRLGEEDAGMLDGSSFLFQNEENQELEQAGVSENGFSFKTLPRSMDKIAQMGTDGDTRMNMDRFAVKPSGAKVQGMANIMNEDINPGGKNDMRMSEIMFHFNSVRLSDRDRVQLNEEVLRKALRSDQPLLIVGYSCDIGDRGEREGCARMRAEVVKEYLVSMGVAAGRIEISEVGNPLEGVDRPTTDQRVYARRAAVYHLAP